MSKQGLGKLSLTPIPVDERSIEKSVVRDKCSVKCISVHSGQEFLECLGECLADEWIIKLCSDCDVFIDNRGIMGGNEFRIRGKNYRNSNVIEDIVQIGKTLLRSPRLTIEYKPFALYTHGERLYLPTPTMSATISFGLFIKDLLSLVEYFGGRLPLIPDTSVVKTLCMKTVDKVVTVDMKLESSEIQLTIKLPTIYPSHIKVIEVEANKLSRKPSLKTLRKLDRKLKYYYEIERNVTVDYYLVHIYYRESKPNIIIGLYKLAREET